MFLLLLPLFIFFFQPLTTEAKFFKTNVTDFSKCTVYYSRSGSVYKDFYELSEKPANGTLLDFHFSVMAASDAHILLAPSSDVEKGDPVYEIVIGAGGNTFCDIRRMQKSAVKATVRVKGLLSGLDMQSFWIHLTKDGVLDVGKEGEELGFLSWTDPDPLPLKVFSFSTWSGVEAKWYFDCPRSDNSSSDSKKIEKPLTPLEKLRRDFLLYYDPFVRPVQNASNITVVEITLSTNLVTLEEHQSTLKYNGAVKLTWFDEKLQWSPVNYSGLNTMHIFRREIWVPHLYLFNSADAIGDILEDTMLVVTSSGLVIWRTSINLNSWCSPDDLGRWPRDEHACFLILGFYKDFQNLQLIFNANESQFITPYSSRWEILEVENVPNKGWANPSARNLKNFDPPGLSLYFKLKRTSNSFTVLLFTPFFVITVSLLLTFWVSPFGPLKISLACLQLILCSITLIGLAMIIPIHSELVPNLVLLYSYSLIASLISIIIAIVVINLSRIDQKSDLPHWVTAILLTCSLKMFLCLPNLKSSEHYGNLNDSATKLNDNQQSLWLLFAVAIDRVAFLIYLSLTIYAFWITY